MAIPISRGIKPIARSARLRYRQRLCRFAGLAATLAALGGGPDIRAADATNSTPVRPASPETLFTARARRAFFDARRRFQTVTNDAEVAWQFGRACFDLAEWAADSAERAELAETGIAACRQQLARAPDSAAAHYYLGMNLGQLARTKGLGALKLVNEMEREFSAARELDASLDYGGSDRNLALLYRDAPSIGSIGSRTKARRNFRNALELAPDYPENQLNLIETYLEWNDRTTAEKELKTLDKLWPDAQKKFTGPAWDASWYDWNKRYDVLKKKIQGTPRPIESPRRAE